MSSTWIISQSAFIFLCMSCLISLILSEPMKIRPKQCSNAIGEEGTCMFVWECIKTEGKHLGTCVDGFLFGSCCGHNESFNSLDQANEPSEPSIPLSIELSTTTKHKNKWKPATTITVTSTTTVAPVKRTTMHPTTSISTVQSPPIKNATNSVWSQFPGISKPMTSQRPWYIYPGNRPVMGSTVRPVIISVLATNKPSAHLPLLSNIPNKNYTHRPTFIPTLRPTPSSTLLNEWTTSALLGETSSKIPNITVITGSPDADQGSASQSVTSPESTTTLAGQVSESAKRPPIEAKSQCGVTQLRPKTKVVGGKNSAFGAWPWQVSVRRTHFFGFSSTHRCGGAILNNQWIATAGHCVDDLLLTQIRIRVGEYDFSSSLEPLPHVERGAKKKIVHPKYNFFTYENDLALVQLDEPIEFLPHISAICLPPDGVNLLGKNATVTGWGRLSEGGVLPTVLQEVRVPIMSNDKCKNMFLSAGRHEYIPDIFMCAGYDEGGRDSCQGDSGGPLTVQNDDGRWFLAGIISWGIGCGEPSLPGVCTRISKFKQWILSYIAN